MSGPTLTVTSDFTDQFNAIIKKFKRDAVLVGVPSADATREDEKGEPEESGQINNAALMAINEFGSPLNNIPARPVMAIGIRNAQDAIAETMKVGTQKALSKGLEQLSITYNRVGIIASTSIKKAINSQEGIDEPSEATLAARKARGFKGTKALLVTGQLRNSITYVVQGEQDEGEA